MISAWHLLWIVPLTSTIVTVVLCCIYVNHLHDSPNHDPVGKQGPPGLCPACGAPGVIWEPETDKSHWEKCGWHN